MTDNLHVKPDWLHYLNAFFAS